MMQKKNRGVTLVEVLVALAIFLVLMVPLVSSLVTSVKTTDSAKTTQGRNEYAQVIMENVKNAPIDDLKDPSLVKNYFEGSENVTTTLDSAKPSDFTILGTTYLGTQHTEYSYKVKVNEIKKSDTYGIMEDLDPDKVAIVPVTFSNYDDVALDAIVAQDMATVMSDRLKDTYEDTDKSRIFNKTDSGDTIDFVDPRSISPEDTKQSRKVLKSDTDTAKDERLSDLSVGRKIYISVASSLTGGYDVTYQLSYVEIDADTTVTPDNYKVYVTYEPYRKHFDKIPNIYLMYNAGVIDAGIDDLGDHDRDNDVNKAYITNDYVFFNLKKAKMTNFGDSDRINAFVIRTATDYTKVLDNYKLADGSYSETGIDALKSELNNIYKNRVQKDYKKDDGSDDEAAAEAAAEANGLGTQIKNNNKTLYREIAPSRDQTIHFYEVTNDASKTDHFRIYHNLFAADGSSLAATDELLSRVVCPHCHKTSAVQSGYICDNCGNVMKGATDPDPAKVVDDLTKAHEEVWYIYSVKIWMLEGGQDNVRNLGDADSQLITLSGTRGGGEIE